MFGDLDCPYVLMNEGRYREVSVCVRVRMQVLVPVTRTQLQGWLGQMLISVLCNSLSASGLGLTWWLHSVGIFDLTLLSSTTFGFHLAPSHPHPSQQERERGEQDWESCIYDLGSQQLQTTPSC